MQHIDSEAYTCHEVVLHSAKRKAPVWFQNSVLAPLVDDFIQLYNEFYVYTTLSSGLFCSHGNWLHNTWTQKQQQALKSTKWEWKTAIWRREPWTCFPVCSRSRMFVGWFLVCGEGVERYHVMWGGDHSTDSAGGSTGRKTGDEGR